MPKKNGKAYEAEIRLALKFVFIKQFLTNGGYFALGEEHFSVGSLCKLHVVGD